MAYNAQAFGSFVVDVGINDVKARKSLQNFRRELSRLKSEMGHNIEYYRQLGDDAGLLKAKQDGLIERIKAQKDYIKQLNYTKKQSIGNSKVENEEYNQLLITIQKAENGLRIFEQSEKKVAMQIASNAGKIKNLNRYHKEQIDLIEATSKRMEAQGKRYGALRLSAEKYTQSIRDSNKEVRLHKQGLRQLEEQGLKDTYLYRQQQANLEKAVTSRLKSQKAYADFEKNKPVAYAKIRREQNDIPATSKRIESVHKGRTAEVEALRSTGNADSYEEARASARIKRMTDLSKQIQAEENALTKKVSNTEYGGKIRETIGKMRKEYGELEDKQRRYGEGLDGLNRKNQKTIDIMKNEYQTLELTGQHFKAQLTEANSLKAQISLLNDQRVRENKELEAVGTKYGKQSDQYLDQSKKVTTLNRDMVNLNKRIKEIDVNTGGAYGAMSRFSDYVSKHQTAFDHIGKSLQVTSKGMMAFGGGVGYAIAQGTKLNYKLEQTNNYTKALLKSAGEESNQAIDENLEKAKKSNVELSEKYGIAQDDIAQTQQELAHRGYQSNQMLQATKPLVEGSIATGYKLKDVTNNATGALESFGLRSKDSKTMFENTRKSINAMAYASDMSASSFNDTGIALSYVGPTAKTAGMKLEDTASAVGQLALSHIKGQKAGTGLRKMLDSLITPTAGGKEAMKQLGIQVNDASGKMRPFKQIISDFHDKMQGLSQSQQVNLLHKIFGTTGQASASALINNSNALSKFNDQVDRADSNNYVSGLSDKKMQTPIEQIHRLKTAWEQLSMSLAHSFAPTITNGIQTITNVINKLNNASPHVRNMFKDFAIGIPVLGLVLSPLASIIRNIHTITRAWNRLSSNFSGKVSKDKRGADLLNDSLIEQNRLLSKRRDLINGTGSIGGVNEVGSMSTGNSTVSTAKEERGVNYVSNRTKNLESDLEPTLASKFKSRFGGVEKTGTSLGKVGTEEKLLANGAKSVGKMGKFSKLLQVGGKGIVGLDVATSLMDLIGTNKNNVGDHVGGATGSLAGTALGGLLGSVLPGPGTAIGAGLGGFAGEWLGKKVGTKVQNSSKEDKLPKDSQDKYDTVEQVNNASFEKQLSNDESNSSSKNKNNTSDKQNSENNSKSSNNGFNSAIDKLSKDKENDEKQSNDDIHTINDFLKTDKNNKGKGRINELDVNSSSSKEKQSLDNGYDDAISKVNDVKNFNGSDDDRVDKLQKANDAIVQAEAQSSAQQTEIKAKLSAKKGEITDKEAGKLIASANKVQKAQISSAKQSYKQQKKHAEDTYNARITAAYRAEKAGVITKSQYNQIISDAEDAKTEQINKARDAKKGQIHHANQAKKKVVKTAREQTKDHLASVDDETGQSLGKFQSWYNSVKQMVSGWVGKKVNGFKKWGQKHPILSKGITNGIKNTGISIAKHFTFGGFSNGTNGVQETQDALVNEKGRESVYNPKTNKFKLLTGGPQIARLEKGDHVLNAKDTRKLLNGGLGEGKKLNGYVDGTGYQNDNSYLSFSKGTNENIDGVYDYTSDKLDKIKKEFKDSFTDIHDNTIDNTKDLVKEYSKIFGKLPTLTHDSIKGSIDSLNGGFNSINNTLNQFGSHENVLKPIHYATGSNGAVAKEHDAIVNDAKTGNEQEAIIRNDGVFLPKYKDAKIHLNKGDAVLNGSQTRKFLNGTGLAHYKNGTGVSDKDLERLIKLGNRDSSKRLSEDFNVKITGSDLQKGLTDRISNYLNEPMNKWYGTIFNVLNHARKDGVGLGDMKDSSLVKLAKKQLGKKRLDFVSEKLNGLTNFTSSIPTKYHKQLLEHAGIPENDWADYNYIINNESGWNPRATNPNGGAYGLPQSLPANKMASAGSDWRTNPITQLRWQHNYIMDRYGSADNARKYWQANHNYENGGLITQEQIAKVGEHNKPEMILPLTDKFRTVQLAKQAVDFVNKNDSGNSSSDVRVNDLEDRVSKLNDNLDKVVSLLEVMAKNSGMPSKAYITDKEVYDSVMKKKHKENIQSAMRRGETIG